MSGKLLHKGVQQLYNDIQRLATFQFNKAGKGSHTATFVDRL